MYQFFPLDYLKLAHQMLMLKSKVVYLNKEHQYFSANHLSATFLKVFGPPSVKVS
jgi:hypothetical protein